MCLFIIVLWNNSRGLHHCANIIINWVTAMGLLLTEIMMGKDFNSISKLSKWCLFTEPQAVWPYRCGAVTDWFIFIYFILFQVEHSKAHLSAYRVLKKYFSLLSELNKWQRSRSNVSGVTVMCFICPPSIPPTSCQLWYTSCHGFSFSILRYSPTCVITSSTVFPCIPFFVLSCCSSVSSSYAGFLADYPAIFSCACR